MSIKVVILKGLSPKFQMIPHFSKQSVPLKPLSDQGYIFISLRLINEAI